MSFRHLGLFIATGLLATSVAMWGQAPAPATAPSAPNAPELVAGIPVNYDEAKVGSYTLPDALKLANGKHVKCTGSVKEAKRRFGRDTPASA